jgi:hypothetical protein
VVKRSLPLPRRRIVNDAELASYLNKGVTWLGQNRHSLEAQGFPRRLPVIGGNDLDAVDQWLDRLHTTTSTNGNGSSVVNIDGLWKRATGNGRQ